MSKRGIKYILNPEQVIDGSLRHKMKLFEQGYIHNFEFIQHGLSDGSNFYCPYDAGKYKRVGKFIVRRKTS